ncbi:hypothetical protein BV20DRAFT_1033100 [Pilatotrama ljubarskyi]|nr:hypothetical protein BV20DRAFT_1033100 [Pilatotrama ljubarskyi]
MLTPPPVVSSQSLSALGYTAFSSHNNDEDGTLSDSGYSNSSQPSTSATALPDPSQFPDPYPYRPSRWHLGSATPALSSADSSSASTRSSAYTGSAKSGDYGHVHVALGGEDESGRGVGVGITTDDVVHLLSQESGASSSASQGRTPIDQGRWSDFYANGLRSRSSSLANGPTEPSQDKPLPPLRATPSFDMGWQQPDERDEVGIGSEDDLDDDPSFDVDVEVDDDDTADEPTSAAIMAEEGRGVIVRGNDTPIVRLHVHPDTTHLLIGSSRTPDHVPNFLANTLPQISSSLLALDISANFLSALPPSLSACVNLEELNIAHNPLRALPMFLATLTNLRVLIADSTGISTLPESLASLERLHTLSIRRNKMHSLPSWLCELTALEMLLVDGNPFQGPWKALMDPLLSRSPLSPGYQPSTPMFPLPSASIRSTMTATTDGDAEEASFPADRGNQDEEDLTVTSPRAPPHLARSVTAPAPNSTGQHPSPGLSRTRTTPNRAYYDKNRTNSKGPKSMFSEAGPSELSRAAAESEKEVRRMKSAGELRRNNGGGFRAPSASASSSPQRGALADYVGSASSSNLLSMGNGSSQDVPRRFASLGVASGAMSPTTSSRSRRTVDSSLWDSPTEEETFSPRPQPVPPLPNKVIFPQEGAYPMEHALPARPRSKEDKDKGSRWGFLKKMSMGKMRTDQPPLPTRSSLHQSQVSQSGYPTRPPPPKQVASVPLLDVRISTTGTLLHQDEPPVEEMPIAPSLSRKHSHDLLKMTASPLDQLKKMSNEAAKQVPPIASNNLLVPGVPTSRSNKRRSFLPIDVSPIPIPAASQFVPGVTATNSSEEAEEPGLTAPSPVQPSPVQPVDTYEEIQRREEERAREARIRALRSVMAYLRDMHDLGRSQTQSQTISMYGLASPDSQFSGTRSRRPTMVDNGRLPSESSVASIASGGSPSSRPDSVNLRSTEGRVGIRTGSMTQTNSVATTDSTGSAGADERKYKDDKAKRARVIREIVETERTYVKGLQELVDIYIKPASAVVNGLSGVGQNKDTVLPAQERKIVFSGLEALFYFHRESFLPALERASAPLLLPREGSQADPDGQLSLYVARDVANTFVSHAAFMKMYSTYINNFDNSVQRIKTWTSEKTGASTPGQTLSPSSSSSQLVGLGLAMTAGIGNTTASDGGSASAASLTSSQRKRIKAYLKRCRMNPRHSQLNLEGYLLLPVQRIPRYRLLLEELVRSCPPMYEYMDDPIDRALTEIASLATNMNEGKRESESRRKLVQWQSRIRGKFPSPLVQPHRRLIMDGPLQLTRVVRKATLAFEVIDAQGDASSIEVECLSPELTPRSLIGILCNDLLVLCRDPSDGQDPNSSVDLWAVLRMQTLPQPASIVHGNTLRLVDNKAILYFDAPSTSDALTWYRGTFHNVLARHCRD